MSRKTVVDIISSLFIVLFVYTAVSKWLNFDAFQAVISQSPLIGSFAPVVAWFLPVLELMVAALLVFPTVRKMGLYGAFILMVVFTCYISYMLLFSPHLPCSCGGVIQYLSWRTHLLFNAIWIVLALIAIQLTATNSKGVSRKPF